MTVEYRALLQHVPVRHDRDTLSPFFRFLSASMIEPENVTDGAVKSYSEFRAQTRFKKVTTANLRRLTRIWNALASSCPAWPDCQLTLPPRAAATSGPPLEDFPAGLQEDMGRYFDSLTRSRRDPLSGRRLKACKQITIDMRRRELVAAIRTAVAAGIPLDQLGSLAAVLAPHNVEKIIDAYWTRNGERPALYTIELAWRFLTMARALGLDDETIEKLEDLHFAIAEHRPKGLTEKNRVVVRAVLQVDLWTQVIALPTRMMAEARAGSTSQPAKARVTAHLAVAIRILTVAPVRINNLASIRLGFNLVRPGGPGSPYLLTFPDYDVKNNVPLEFPLDPETTSIIDEYIRIHRPGAMNGHDHDCLFPGKAHDQRLTRGLGEQMSARLWKMLGVRITPHQFRHAAAAIMLRADPGNYEFVRRVLGHRNLATTTAFYIGLETLQATERYSEILLAAGGNTAVPKKGSRKNG
jgi:integrase